MQKEEKIVRGADLATTGQKIKSYVLEQIADKQDTIDTVNVSVDNTTGTPSASASISGGIMNFAFSGIKGATGPQGPQGPQGNPGSSQDYPFELENDPTVGGTTKAATAESVKTVHNEVSQLGLKVGDLSDYDEIGYQPLAVTVKTGYYFYFSTLAEVASAAYEYAEISVQPGEKYRITGYNTNANIPLAIARKAGTTTKLRAISQSASAALTGEYTIPAGYDTLYVNGRTANAPIVVEKWVESPGTVEGALDKIESTIGDANISIDGEENMTSAGTKTSGKYIKLDLTTENSSDYEYVALSVQAGERYYIEGWNINANVPICTFANSSTSLSTRGMSDASSKGMNGIVTVPIGYDTMYVNGNVTQHVYVVIQKLIVGDNLTDAAKIIDANVASVSDAMAPLYVQVYERDDVYAGTDKAVTIEIARRFDETNDVVWRFENKTPTPNTFFDLRGVGVVPRGASKIQDFICVSNLSYLVQGMSDFISPIRVAAVNNADGDFPTNTSLFTGGAHGYNNSALSSASATMRQISRAVYLDGMPLSAGDRKYGNVVTIDVLNNIQGSNTEKSDGAGREIIQQHIHVQVDRDKVNVGVTFTALEAVSVYAIEGLSQVFAFTNIRFIGSTTLRGVYEAGHRAVTEDKHTNTIRNSGDTYYFDVSMDRSFGLAQDGGMADYNAMATIANKGYFHLIGETPLALAAGESVAIRGSYDFGKLPATS